MSLEIWDNPMHTFDFRLEVAVAEINKLREHNKVLQINNTKFLEINLENERLARELTSKVEALNAQTNELVALREELAEIKSEAETNQKWAFLEWRQKAKELADKIVMINEHDRGVLRVNQVLLELVRKIASREMLLDSITVPVMMAQQTLKDLGVE